EWERLAPHVRARHPRRQRLFRSRRPTRLAGVLDQVTAPTAPAVTVPAFGRGTGLRLCEEVDTIALHAGRSLVSTPFRPGKVYRRTAPADNDGGPAGLNGPSRHDRNARRETPVVRQVFPYLWREGFSYTALSRTNRCISRWSCHVAAVVTAVEAQSWSRAVSISSPSAWPCRPPWR